MFVQCKVRVNYYDYDDGWEPSQGRRGELMKEGIHPEYYQAKVTCNCGNELPDPQRRRSTLKSVLSVIRSTLASRRQLPHADVLISLTVSMV